MDKTYCYPDTDTLINRLGIHSSSRLVEAETRIISIRLYQLHAHPISGSFDLAHLCRIHRFIFQDLYSWAGELRTVNIAKKSLFCLVQHMSGYAQTIFPAYYHDCMRAKENPDDFIQMTGRSVPHLKFSSSSLCWCLRVQTCSGSSAQKSRTLHVPRVHTTVSCPTAITTGDGFYCCFPGRPLHILARLRAQKE